MISFSLRKHFSSNIKQALAQIIPKKREELTQIKKQYGDKEIGKVTVDQVIGGMRNIFGLFYDGSLLDSKTGITFRDYNIPDLKQSLQKAPGGEEPLPEALFWLLTTGEVPSHEDYESISNEFKQRGELKPDVIDFILRIPKETHPMTMLSMTLLYLQKDSIFAQKYGEGTARKQIYWEFYLDDSLNLLAKINQIAAIIYRHKYKNGEIIPPDFNLDWAGNYAHMLGYSSHEVKECIRGYLTIHSDHEGGNVSAHTCHLVGSALSDPYLSYSAALNGLAGPLHGLANQEVLKWLLEMQRELGPTITDEKITQYVMDTLKSGKVVPGYGHAVLRHTDPRFLHQKAFAEKYIKNDPIVNLVKQCYNVIPPVLKTVGKIKNPWPNVDAHSGCLLYHYGMKEFDYYTVVFAVSRALGCMSNLVWSRAFGLPIERPGSVTMNWIKEKFSDEHKFDK